MALAEQLRTLVEAPGYGEVVELSVNGALAELGATSAENPLAVALALERLADGRDDVGLLTRRLVDFAQLLPDDRARGLLGAVAALGPEYAGAVVAGAGHRADVERLVPAEVIVAAASSVPVPEDWAVDLLASVANRFDWQLLAEMLDRAALLGVASPWLSAALERQPWARQNPSPSPNARVPELPPLEAERARIPAAELYAADDPRVASAEAQAASVSEEAARWSAGGRSPNGWLRQLGASLPGCGQPLCCRSGLLELALIEAGYDLRAGMTIQRPSMPPGGAEPEDRFHTPDPPGPNFWKTVAWRWSRVRRRR